MVICLVYRKGWYKCQQRELYKVEIGEKEEFQPSTDKSISLRVLDL